MISDKKAKGPIRCHCHLPLTQEDCTDAGSDPDGGGDGDCPGGLGPGAGALFLVGSPRTARPSWLDAGWVLGVGAGFYLGCWMLEISPHWPPLEDLDRLLVLVIPAVLAVEMLAAFPQVPRWLTWASRLAVAGCGARVLLHGSSYLSDLAGPEAGGWSPAQAWLILGSLAAAEATAWVLLVLLARRATGVSLVVCLAVAAGRRR